MKEFGNPGYEATVKELDDNLIGIGAVEMIMSNEINKDIRCGALSYLMFTQKKEEWEDSESVWVCGWKAATRKIYIKG
jgi:hypothetical protein